ncbi:hypothetical protein [Streptomyces longispororuber]|uniref:hypothetical protein n=1 Tax=Streptomyces longispororuber TaxID=68230 RepID=UPI0027E2B8DB|nr:hypothetical protein [Streptomyces longispororuber]
MERTAIIGSDPRVVETVLGRLTVGRAALTGAGLRRPVRLHRPCPHPRPSRLRLPEPDRRRPLRRGHRPRCR